MKIKIKREGGFIGITSKANIEYDELTPAEQNALNTLAEQSLIAKNKPNGSSKEVVSTVPEAKTRDLNGGAEIQKRDIESIGNGLELAGDCLPHNGANKMMRDAFSYSISMKKDGKTVSLQYDDMTAPPEIVEIFQKYVQY